MLALPSLLSSTRLRAGVAALLLGASVLAVAGTSAPPAAFAAVTPAAKMPTGTYVMVKPEDYLAAPITASSSLVTILSRPYVRGIGLQVGWKDLAPSSSQPAGDTAMVKTMLDRIAAAEKLAGRTASLPIFLKYYPADLPYWLRTPNPPATPELRTNSLGMQVVSSSTQHLYNGNTDMPYSVDPAYQQQVSRQMATLSSALQSYDPRASRVVAMGFIAPFMTSAQMRVPYLPAEGFARTGTDPYWGQWTKDGHLAAIRSFTSTMAAHSQFRLRAWAFNATSTPLLLNSEQMGVKSALVSAHPARTGGVVSKTENLSVTYDTATTSGGLSFRDHIVRQTPTFGPVAVIKEPSHGWELWAPFREGCSGCTGPYAMPRSSWPDLLRNSMFSDLQNATPTQLQRTMFVELWATDLVAPSPELDSFLTTWDRDIRAAAARP